MSVSSASSATEVYNIGTVNNALNDLGMLSAITESRKEYLQECLKNSMEKENVDQAGPSTSRRESQKSSKSASCTTEKENTSIGGFQVLTMNSTFITSFRAGYELPRWGSIKEPSGKRVYKCTFTRRRRLRTHPYDDRVSNTGGPDEFASGSYRLRTTSLSSGTCHKTARGTYSNVVPSGSSTSHLLVRSRSMENLSASMGETLILTSKPRELETVFRGIQQLRMDDCTSRLDDCSSKLDDCSSKLDDCSSRLDDCTPRPDDCTSRLDDCT